MSKIEDTCFYDKALEELDKAEYIHYNIPKNELETYEETIKWVNSINIEDPKMLEPSGIRGYKVIDMILCKINAQLDYYNEINDIYQKTSFVIKDCEALSFLEITLTAIEEFYIKDEVKEKLNEAIALLYDKKSEILHHKHPDIF